MSGKRCKQCLALLAAGALMLALLSGCATEKDSGGDPAELSSFEAEVIRLVNEERAEYGLPALTTTDALTAAAAKRAEEISGDYGHDRPDGSSCFTVLPIRRGTGTISSTRTLPRSGWGTPTQTAATGIFGPRPSSDEVRTCANGVLCYTIVE